VFAADKGNGRAPVAPQSRTFWKVLATVLGVGGIAALGCLVIVPAIRPQGKRVATIAPAPEPVKAQASPDNSTDRKPPSAGRDSVHSTAEHQDPPPVPPAPKRKVRGSSDEKQSVSNFAATMEKELKNGNFAGVLKACEGPDAQPVEAKIFKSRALQGLGNESALAQFLRNTDLNDGEWYLAKARLSFKKAKYHECENFLLQGQDLPCAVMSTAALNREISYYNALCAAIRFDANPNGSNYTKATGAWLRVQELAGTSPYGKKAAAELARMEKTMQGGE
jgi:hypothetical protein